MSDPFVAEIRIFSCSFAPKGWAFCNGQLMPISQNTAVFSLVGTFYGGDGKSTFGLPDLQGSAAMHVGQGNGLSLRFLGETGGSDSVTLLESEIPQHQHSLNANSQQGDNNAPGSNVSLARSTNATAYLSNPGQSLAKMAPEAVSFYGSGQAHNNVQPYLTLNFCIALQGIFPPRS